MNYRELLVGGLSATAVCACSLLISEASFSSSIGNADSLDSIGSSFYISGHYSPAFPSVTKFDIIGSGMTKSKITGYKKTEATIAVATHANFDNASHSFKFARSMISFDGAVGYVMGSARIEMEGSYRNFDSLAVGDYANSEAYKFVAVSDGTITNNNYFVLKVEGITDISLMLNACYDVLNTEFPVSPYVCAGVGASFVDIAKHVTSKAAYGGKIGISYQLTPEISLTAGGFYHGIFDEEYGKIPATDKASYTKEAKATVKSNLSHYGFNLGARFLFS